MFTFQLLICETWTEQFVSLVKFGDILFIPDLTLRHDT